MLSHCKKCDLYFGPSHDCKGSKKIDTTVQGFISSSGSGYISIIVDNSKVSEYPSIGTKVSVKSEGEDK